MKARTLILTAGMAVALVALAAQPAAAMFPTDGAKSVGLLAGGKLQPVRATAGATKASATMIKASAYSKFAYVHGGASARVGKAITAAGKRMAKQSSSQPSKPSTGSTGTHGSSVSTWTPGPTVTPGSFDPGDNACLVYSVCTPEEDCAIWGYNCSLLEAPQVIPTPAPEPGPGDGWVYIEPPEILYPTLVDVSSQSSTPVSSTEETYEDC
jgi:hypothetical protein